MRQYILRRTLLIIPTLVLVSIIIFTLIRLVPGDMVDLLADERGVASTVWMWRQFGRSWG